MTGRLTKARVIKMPISSATPCALRTSFSACIFAATLSALLVLINPATGSASSATTCPSATNASPPLFFRTVLPASIISVSLSPATIRLWESCAMLDATAPHFRLKFDFLTCGLVLPLFYHALPLRKRCQEQKWPRRACYSSPGPPYVRCALAHTVGIYSISIRFGFSGKAFVC